MIAGRIINTFLFLAFTYFVKASENVRYLDTDTLRFIKMDYINLLSDTFPYEDTSVYSYYNGVYYVVNYQGATPYIYMFNRYYIIYINTGYPVGVFDKITQLMNIGNIEVYKINTDKTIGISNEKSIKKLQNLICCNECYKFKFKDFVYITYEKQRPVINPNLFNDILKVINKRKVRKKFRKCFP